MVDTHAHLAATASFPPASLDDVLARSWAAGLSDVIVPAGAPEEFSGVAALATRPHVRGMLGYHPDTAERCGPADVAALVPLLAQPGIVGIGEAGIDLYWKDSPQLRAQQEALCAAQLNLARKLNLPISLHLRDVADRNDAAQLLLQLVRVAPVRAVIHSCTASAALVQELVDAGCMISFSGILTFKSAAAVREAAAMVPLERLLVETDAPFLAPVPHRGATCEPAFVRDTARALADVRGTDDEALWAQLGENAQRFFSLGS